MRLKPIAISIPSLLIGCLLLALAFGCGDDKAHEDAWLSFSMAMDKAFGEKGWTYSGHSYRNSTLTVEGFSVGDGSPEGGEAAGAKPGTLAVKTVTVAGLPSSQDMGRILASPDWAGTKDETLAQVVTLKGVTLGMESEALAVGLTIDAAQLDQITLAAATGDLPKGPLGFLKASRLGKLSYKGLKASFKEPESMGNAKMFDMTLDSYSLAGLDFSGTGLFGDGSVLDVISSARMANVDWSNIALGIVAGAEGNKWEFSIGSFSIKNLDGLGKYGDITLKYLRGTLPNLTPKIKTADIKLSEYSIQNLDMRYIFKGMLESSDSEYLKDIDSWYIFKFINEIFSVAALFTYHYSFDSWKLSGLDWTADGLAFGLASLDYQGPTKRNVIPNSKIKFTGAYLNIKDPSVLPHPHDSQAAELIDILGMDSFKANGAINVTYDPVTGSVTYDYAGWAFESLGELSFSVELTGLTQSFVDVLARIPIHDLEEVLEDPGFEKFGIGKLSFDFKDNSLTQRLIRSFAERNGQSPADLTENLRQAVALDLNSVLPETYQPMAYNAIVQSFGDYLGNPKSFALSSNPQQATNPRALVLYIALLQSDDRTFLPMMSNILNNLNLGISVNGEPVTILRFR
ncbi:MAG: hypothetical protein LBF40_07825 [Deltaproteobacteria bacterium]|jgi:hypothetical protein|nr:hypothetical protein [Deltaproteobacteria bacterium]